MNLIHIIYYLLDILRKRCNYFYYIFYYVLIEIFPSQGPIVNYTKLMSIKMFQHLFVDVFYFNINVPLLFLIFVPFLFVCPKFVLKSQIKNRRNSILNLLLPKSFISFAFSESALPTYSVDCCQTQYRTKLVLNMTFIFNSYKGTFICLLCQ